MAIDTLLFDLDGTLVRQFQPGSTLQFTFLVLRRLRGLGPLPLLYRAGKAAVEALQNHSGEQTNFEVMIAEFSRHLVVDPGELRRRVYQLAEEDFRAMRWRFKPIPGAREAILLGRARGFRLVLATNPTVPLPMTRHRLEWACLGDIQWDFLTHPENMTHTKPDVAYYSELLAKLETSASHCLMIGNDFRKDLPAMRAGIQTFLLDGPQTRKARKARATYQPDYCGTFADLDALIRRLADERAAAPPA